jgi:integrase
MRSAGGWNSNRLTGVPVESSAKRIRTVKEILVSYRADYELNHRSHSIASLRSALKTVEEHIGALRLPDLNEDRIRQYIRARKTDGVSGRTINVELGELSRAIGKPWRLLWPHLRQMEERHDTGRALTADEKQRLLKAVDASRSMNLKTLIRAALLTGARAGELTSLRWSQVDFNDRVIIIGLAKTRAGTGRVIPMNAELLAAMSAHAVWFTRAFGEAKPDQYAFPFGSPVPKDPTRPTVEIKTAWSTIRKAAVVNCRWHDLRHTACSDMNEAGVSEALQLAIFGWSSRKMMERYAHVRTEARRDAMNTLTLKVSQRAEEQPDSIGVPQESPTVAVSKLVM